MANVKVAYMMGSLNRGGAETIMLDLFRHYQSAPFALLGIHRKDGAYREEFYNSGVKMVECSKTRIGLIRYLWRLRRIFKQEQVTHVHAQHWIDGIYARLATIGMDIRLVETLHGYFPQKGIVGMLSRLSIRMVDDVCFVSRHEQEWYQRQMKIADDKCHVIFNGVDFGKIDSVVERGMCKVEGKVIKLCMVGNFVKVRDHMTLVKALTRVKSQEPRIESFDFYFIGKRSEDYSYIYDECVRVCEENKMTNVHFLGGRGDVPALLRQMDGFVYSTDHDSFGIAVVEAMASGLPIVVNDWPVMKEVCGEFEENYVRYFRSKDVESCAEAIQQLLKDISASTAEFKSRCAHNAQWARERYSIETYIATLSKIYKS